MIPTPEEAWALLCAYNQGEFHRKHGRIVGDVLRWYAVKLGYEQAAAPQRGEKIFSPR